MSLNGENSEIKTVNFDGEQYAVDSLTPRVVEGFSMLVRLQNEIADLAYQLKKSQAAQTTISNELKAHIQIDKIKAQEEVIGSSNA